MILSIAVLLILALLLFVLYDSYQRDSEIMNPIVAQRNTLHLAPYAIVFLLILAALSLNIVFNKSSIWKISLVLFFLLQFLALMIIKLKVWQTQSNQGSVVFHTKQDNLLSVLLIFVSLLLIFSEVVIDSRPSAYPSVYGNLFILLVGIAKLASHVEIREHGISGGFFALKWQDIDFFVWQEDFGIIHIQHRALWPINRRLQMKLTEDVKDTGVQFLMQHLPSACPR
jgi:hypothetical protein